MRRKKVQNPERTRRTGKDALSAVPETGVPLCGRRAEQ